MKNRAVQISSSSSSIRDFGQIGPFRPICFGIFNIRPIVIGLKTREMRMHIKTKILFWKLFPLELKFCFHMVVFPHKKIYCIISGHTKWDHCLFVPKLNLRTIPIIHYFSPLSVTKKNCQTFNVGCVILTI